MFKSEKQVDKVSASEPKTQTLPAKQIAGDINVKTDKREKEEELKENMEVTEEDEVTEKEQLDWAKLATEHEGKSAAGMILQRLLHFF